MQNKLSVSLVKRIAKRCNIVRKHKSLPRNKSPLPRNIVQEKRVHVEQSERVLVRREQHKPPPPPQQEQAAPKAVRLDEEEEHPIV